MSMVRLVVGGMLALSLLTAVGLVLQDARESVAQAADPAEVGSAVLAAAPIAPTVLPPTMIAAATIPPPPAPRASDPPVVAGSGQIGSQAIVPHLTPAAPGQPTFTEEDVRAAIAANGLDLIRVRVEGPYQIEQVAFLPYAEARAQAEMYVGVPDDRVLCLVTVRGTFTLTGPPIPGQGSNVHTLTTMTLIFDGLTGNHLGEQGQP